MYFNNTNVHVPNDTLWISQHKTDLKTRYNIPE